MFCQKATSAYRLIGAKVQAAHVYGFNETGAEANGKNGWFWHGKANRPHLSHFLRIWVSLPSKTILQLVMKVQTGR
jgi:hypothetical protein